jgi:hypothetical protein
MNDDESARHSDAGQSCLMAHDCDLKDDSNRAAGDAPI